MEKVEAQELQELYAKSYAYKQSLGQLKDEQTKQGYLKFLAGTPEGLVKLKVAHDQMYPDDKEGAEILQSEIDKALNFDPALIGVYIQNIVKDLAELYKKAFALFLENLKPKEKEQEQVEKPRFVQPQEQVRFATVNMNYYNEPIKQKKSIWDKIFNKHKSVEKVNFTDIRKEREGIEAMAQKQRMAAQEQARLDRYNASVKARAQANAMQASFGRSAEQQTYQNVMQRGA